MIKRLVNNNKLSIGIIILEIVMNLICYKFLPDKVGFHFDISGNTDGTIPKFAFLFAMPVISIAVYLFYKVFKNASEARASAVCGLIFVLNVVLLYMNLK